MPSFLKHQNLFGLAKAQDWQRTYNAIRKLAVKSKLHVK